LIGQDGSDGDGALDGADAAELVGSGDGEIGGAVGKSDGNRESSGGGEIDALAVDAESGVGIGTADDFDGAIIYLELIAGRVDLQGGGGSEGLVLSEKVAEKAEDEDSDADDEEAFGSEDDFGRIGGFEVGEDFAGRSLTFVVLAAEESQESAGVETEEFAVISNEAFDVGGGRELGKVVPFESGESFGANFGGALGFDESEVELVALIA